MNGSILVSRLRSVTDRRAQLGGLRGAAIGIAVAVVIELLPLLMIFSSSESDSTRHWLAGRLFPGLANGANGRLWATPIPALLLVLLCALIGYVVGWGLIRLAGSEEEREGSSARWLERHVRDSHNLLFTAWELLRHNNAVASRPNDTESAELVTARANKMAGSLNVKALLPSSSALRTLGIAALVWMMAAFTTSRLTPGVLARSAESAVKRARSQIAGEPSVHRVDARVSAPPYAARRDSSFSNPERLTALEGSTLLFTIAASGDEIVITTDSGDVTLPVEANGTVSWRSTVVRDGFVALSAQRTDKDNDKDNADAGLSNRLADSTRIVSAPKLITIVMQPDAAPGVKITKPGKDMVVDSNIRALPVVVEASDDIGLHSLTLLYTVVSGSGEQFEFTEGEAPLRIERLSSRAWHAQATLRLDTLLKEPGDLVVYRALATDGRSGMAPTESESFIVERSAPGGVAAAGFALDPDEDRYAASQQMVILKTERLIAEQASLDSATISQRAREISAEQNRVRAEFVFMTGGEFEQAVVADEEGITELDESAEAEGEAELAAGRMVNRGRNALLTAIRSMSQASVSLEQSVLSTALEHEKRALDQLQEAFARQRFLMRALTQREQLDFTRRLTGTLDSIARTPAPKPPIDADSETERQVLRRALATLMASNSASTRGSGAGNGAGSASTSGSGLRNQDLQSVYSTLAVEILSLEPGSLRARELAALLQRAGRGSRTDAAALDSASLGISAWLDTLSGMDATSRGATRPQQ